MPQQSTNDVDFGRSTGCFRTPRCAIGLSAAGQRRRHGAGAGRPVRSESEAPSLYRVKGVKTIIAVLLGCGLRRRELADLSFDHLQCREDRWAIVELVGKGGHVP